MERNEKQKELRCPTLMKAAKFVNFDSKGRGGIKNDFIFDMRKLFHVKLGTLCSFSTYHTGADSTSGLIHSYFVFEIT